ncbi:recombination protein F [Mycobacteroides abscessus]|nr:recombination protein F [Mycobacteroides abscessus]
MKNHQDLYEEVSRVADKLVSRANARPGKAQFENAEIGTLYSLRMRWSRDGKRDEVITVSREILRRETKRVIQDRRTKSHAKVVHALVSLIRASANMNRSTTASARAMSSSLVADLQSQPNWLKGYLRNAPRSPKPRDIAALTGMSPVEWSDFVSIVVAANARRTLGSVLPGDPGTVDLNVATRLTRIAARERVAEGATLTYDVSDRETKLTRLQVSGFRGSSGTVEMDISKGGKPADVLLWGDNGVGKSTLVDGIEFALQHRVDRSSDFNSSLRAAVRNLSVPTARAVVELSDGTTVSRSLVMSKSGRDVPSDLSVRPGFRIAPIVIRRADILRFLDTDALERGTVFFDYFPDPEGTIGARPDEELRQLEEERFLLRVARDDLAAQLAELYPDIENNFGDSSALDAFVTELLKSVDITAYEHPLDALPQHAREIIEELRSAQLRSSAIKKKLDRGVQTLNPIAYRSQLSRIVPILQTVTEDLTANFKRITRADHVTAIRVLVAKSGPVSLDVVVEFDNGTSALPQQAFSEGYKDLIALLFFLSVTRKAAEFGQARVLILDDALQSVDASIRLGVMDYVLDQFKDWQLIVTGHDRAWNAQLRGLFVRRGRSFVERSVSGWTFAEGVELGGASRTRAQSLREALERRDERMVASGTGLLLEEISQELSWRLGVSIQRREGDRYTLGDLWPAIAKALKTSAIKPVVAEIDLRLDIRNLLGAHYNDWADGISWSDIRQLGQDVLTVYDSAFCSACSSWVTKSGARVACQCGATALK